MSTLSSHNVGHDLGPPLQRPNLHRSKVSQSGSLDGLVSGDDDLVKATARNVIRLRQQHSTDTAALLAAVVVVVVAGRVSCRQSGAAAILDGRHWHHHQPSCSLFERLKLCRSCTRRCSPECWSRRERTRRYLPRMIVLQEEPVAAA